MEGDGQMGRLDGKATFALHEQFPTIHVFPSSTTAPLVRAACHIVFKVGPRGSESTKPPIPCCYALLCFSCLFKIRSYCRQLTGMKTYQTRAARIEPSTSNLEVYSTNQLLHRVFLVTLELHITYTVVTYSLRPIIP